MSAYDDDNCETARRAARIDQWVGERIRRRRTLLGVTQEQLAAHLQISYQQIQKYETGANRVSAGRLFQIAQKLETSVASFFEGLAGPAGEHSSAEAAPPSRASLDLVRNFNRIGNESVRSAVTGLVRSLSEQGADAQDGSGFGDADAFSRSGHDENDHAGNGASNGATNGATKHRPQGGDQRNGGSN